MWTSKLKSLMQDIRTGAYTGGVRRTRYAHLGATDTVSTAYSVISPLLDPVIRDGDVFVDVGCGKGRVLNWAISRHFKAVFGLELDKRTAAKVARRFADHLHVTIVAGDALLSLPDEGTLFYLWNPFNAEVMRRFQDTLIEKYARLGTLARIRIVYYNALHADVWRDPRCLVQPIPLNAEHKAVLITFPCSATQVGSPSNTEARA